MAVNFHLQYHFEVIFYSIHNPVTLAVMQHHKTHQQQFEELFQNLNEEQQLAVNHIEGPVMVIAGPGTGKTQILAARIGNILLKTDSLPENILCLTYTDAGVVAMRRRLLQFIGPAAYKVNIHTFHSFCNEVIQENLSQFEKPALDPISELQQIELFKKLVDEFPKNHPLKRFRGDVYYEVPHLKKLFSDIKREGWKIAELNRAIDLYVKELPEKEIYQYKKPPKGKAIGDLKPDYYAELEKMERLKAAINEFDNYQAFMKKRNLYDFDDMINWVIKAFEENTNLLATYQERYLYILVDEFQDTSGTQNKVVELLINYWEKPNVFVVGDDDQSIYRFQGANVENMLAFAKKYGDDLMKVVLTKNYRSTQPVLDVSKSLIDKNKERLVEKIPGLSKNLISSNSGLQKLSTPPHVQEYETMHEEMIGITAQVLQWVNSGTNPAEIGIIYKENKYGEELAEYLRLKEIPFYTKRSLNIFELPLTQKLITLLRYLNAEHDASFGGDELLFEILHYDWFAIPPIEIAKLSVEANATKYSDNPKSLRQLIAEKNGQPAKDLFSKTVHPAITNASAILEKLIGDVPDVTLQQLTERMVRTTGLLQLIMQSPEKHFMLQVLTVFFDFIKEETKRNPNLTLAQLTGIIDLMQHENIKLPLTQVAGNEKGVNILTVHGSKGLEFEQVFFAGCNAAFWEKKRKPSGGFKMPETVLETGATGMADHEELRRLFYVAITRAKKHLHISYSRFNNAAKEMEASVFVAEIQEANQIVTEKQFIDSPVLAEYQLLRLTEGKMPEIGKLEKDFVTPLVEKFVMNVTALNNYLKCPLHFYYNNLIRIPSGKNDAMEFGSAVHHALEQLFKKMSARSGTDGQGSKKEQFPPLEEFIKDFEWQMHRSREHFTKEQFKSRMDYGQMILTDYYNKYINSFNKIVVIERTISRVAVKGVPIKGKMDKLEFTGLSVNVVDYKTGNPDNAKDKLKPPSDKNPKGGDYWRQAVFYKILIDNYEQKNWEVISTEFDFIEPDKRKEYQRKKLVITPEDITTVTEQITGTWQKIQAHDFYTGCGKDDCHWCNFVKTNQMAVALHDIIEENDEV